MRIPIEEVPAAVRRRAAQHVEAIRDTPMGAPDAHLGDEACPVYRPDVGDEVAYWELEVLGLKGREQAAERGFVVLAAGEHDFPLPHWSFDALPPSRRLEQASADGARVYKLDALSYVAEDGGGKLAAQLAPIPPRVKVPADADPKLSAGSAATVTTRTKDDSDGAKAKHRLRRTDGKGPRAEIGDWDSWEQVKAEYATAFGPHLDALRTRAAEAWRVVGLVEKMGRGIHAGDQLRVALLADEAKVALEGDAARMVQAKLLPRKGGGAVLLDAVKVEGAHELDFTLHLAYGDGTEERLPFFVVPRGAPSNTGAEERTGFVVSYEAEEAGR